MALIIIEGTDACGKSTLSKKLCEHYGLNYFHNTGAHANDYEFYSDIISNHNELCDRLHIGETIWPSVFARDARISFSEYNKLCKLLEERTDAVLIIAEADWGTIERNMNARGERSQAKKREAKIGRIMFDRRKAELEKAGYSVITYNYVKDTLETMIEKIETTMKQKETRNNGKI